MAHLKANSSGAIGDLQEEVAKLRSELASAKSEIASLKEKLNQTEWSNKSLQTHVLDKDTVIENLEKQLVASTLRQQQLQVFLLTPPAFRLRPISSNLAFTLNTLSSSPFPGCTAICMLASCRHTTLCRLRWKQGKLQDLEAELTKLKSRNSELEQSILNTDARMKELEDETKYLKNQADERGSSSGLFFLTPLPFCGKGINYACSCIALSDFWPCITTLSSQPTCSDGLKRSRPRLRS